MLRTNIFCYSDHFCYFVPRPSPRWLMVDPLVSWDEPWQCPPCTTDILFKICHTGVHFIHEKNNTTIISDYERCSNSQRITLHSKKIYNESWQLFYIKPFTLHSLFKKLRKRNMGMYLRYHMHRNTNRQDWLYALGHWCGREKFN